LRLAVQFPREVRYSPQLLRTTQAWRVISEPMELPEHSLEGVGGAGSFEQLAKPVVGAAGGDMSGEIVGVGLIAVGDQLQGIDGPAD
jgi:hypothetical protein